MNKVTQARLSLRKLILATMAVGPLAVLPAPVWAALPAAQPFTVTNGTASWTVSGTTGAGSALIQTSDRAVLVWNAGAFNIQTGETFNFAVPSAGAVLNKVGYETSGALRAATDNAIIDGSLISTGGRVFILANGDIMIGGAATINTANGLVLSTLRETSDFSFTTSGNLSYTGDSRGTITIGSAAASPSISGGLEAHAGAIVMNRASITGDLVLRQTGANTALNISASGALTVTGNLSVTTNNGAISGTNTVTVGSATGDQTAAFSTGLAGNAAITLGSAASRHDYEIVTFNAPGANGDVSVFDSNIIRLGASTIGDDLHVDVVGTHVDDIAAIATVDKLTIGGDAAFIAATANRGVNIAHNSTIAGVLAGSTTNAAFSVVSDGPITVGAATVGAITTTGITASTGTRGQVTLTANGALTINSPITVDAVTSGNMALTGTTITQGAAGVITALAGNRVVSMNATNGGITLDDINARAVTVRANSGSITQTAGSILTTTAATSTFNATNGGSITLNSANALASDQPIQLLGGTVALTNTSAITRLGTVNTTGGVTLALGTNQLILGAGAGTAGQDINIGGILTAVSGAVTDADYTNINIFGGLNLNTSATNAAVTLDSALFAIPSDVRLGRVDINAGTGAVTVVETQTLNLGTITASALTARSTTGGIVDSGTLTISGAATLIVPVGQSIVLDNAGHTIGSLNIQGGSDNAITFGGVGTVLGGLTSTTGNLTLTSTAGSTITIGDATGTLSVANLIVNASGPVSIAGSAAVSGTANITTTDSTAAAITDTAAGALIVTGVTTLSAGGDIVLDSNLHNFSSLVIGNARNVTINDANDLTFSGNATGDVIARAGQGGVANNWSLTLGTINVGSLTAVAGTGGGGNSGAITQTSGTSIHTERIAGFTTTNAAITVNRTGNSFGRVNAAAGNGAINITEDGTLRVGTISTSGNTRLESRFGSIIEDNEANNSTSITTEGTLTLVSNTGSIQLGNTTRASTSTGTSGGDIRTVVATAPTGSVSIRGTSNQILNLGNITALSLNVTSTQNRIQQTSGSSLLIFGSSNFTAAQDITLTNETNNFGRVGLTTTSVDRNISIVEAGTLNLGTVSMGSQVAAAAAAVGNGTFTARSVNGDIIDSGLGGVKIGGLVAAPTTTNAGAILSGTGVATLTAMNGNIILDDPTTEFQTTAGVVFNGKNVVLSPLGQANLILGANGTTSVAENLTATTAIGSISNNGNLTVSGNATFQAGNGNITVAQAGNRFGIVKFTGNNVAISQVNDMNIATGSSAIGSAQLASTGSYVTITNVGGGIVSFGNTVSISAGSSITLPKLMQAVGTLSVNAPGTKDLSALSISGDLSGKSPINLGTGTYLPPQP